MLTIALPHYEFIRISGPDTVTFLQGQVSCDVTSLSSELSLTGALCNLKGRVIADFRLLQDAEDCLLQTQSGMAQVILDALKKYAMFSKVDLRLEPGFAATGLLGEDSAATVMELVGQVPDQTNAVVQRNGISAIALAGSTPRFEIWSQPAKHTDFQHQLQSLPTGNFADWQRQEMRAGVLHVTPELSEQYTPQLLNYDISGVINFRKGCYTGQEVVARMYYRGKAKKRLFLLQTAQDASADLEADERFSVLLQAAPTTHDPEGYLILAIMDAAQAEGDELPAPGSGEAVRSLSLPYAP